MRRDEAYLWPEILDDARTQATADLADEEVLRFERLIDILGTLVLHTRTTAKRCLIGAARVARSEDQGGELYG